MKGLAEFLATTLLSLAQAAATTEPEAETIEIEVDVKEQRPDWLFPGLDHPRVQQWFRSSSMVGESLFDTRPEPLRHPLVRVGSTIVVRGAESAAERREARRWARRMVAERMTSFESCFADARQRETIDASRITLRLNLDGRTRSPISISAGVLGDDAGNECLQGVLAFASRRAPSLAGSVELEVPVWFWMQTER